MSRARWDRLAADLAAAGIEARVDELPYTEELRGRRVSGVTRSITLRHPAGGLVEVSDQWWARNPDTWLGWTVTREGADSIIRAEQRRLTKRSLVLAAVKSMLG
jgi:hypothetical protein